MIAAVFHGPGEMEVAELDTPEVGADEVLVEVGANTLCGTDVRILRGEKTRGVRRPSILGHEFAGRVAKVGDRVRGYEVGAPVAMAPVIPCLRCFYCQHGMENACTERRAMGYELRSSAESRRAQSRWQLGPPEAAILAVGRAVLEWEGNGWVTHRVISVILSVDHRVADGARFLEDLQAALLDWELLL